MPVKATPRIGSRCAGRGGDGLGGEAERGHDVDERRRLREARSRSTCQMPWLRAERRCAP